MRFVTFEPSSVTYSGHHFASVKSVTVQSNSIIITVQDSQNQDEYVSYRSLYSDMAKIIMHLGSKSSFYFRLFRSNYNDFLDAFHLEDDTTMDGRMVKQWILIKTSLTESEQTTIRELLRGIKLDELSSEVFDKLVN